MGYWMACKFEAAPILVGSCQFCALFCLLSFFHTVRDTNKQLLLILNASLLTTMLASCLQAFLSVSVSGPLRFQVFPLSIKKKEKKA
jgi:hypothetical protein